MNGSEATPTTAPRVFNPDAGPMSADAYRRHARRLRDRHAGRPGDLHRALRDLAQERDRHRARERGSDFPNIDPDAPRPQVVTARRATGSLRASNPVTPHGASAARFTAEVHARIAGGLLRYSDRLALLRTARRIGLSRFDANLLIAAAQHQYRPAPLTEDARPPGLAKHLKTALPIAAFLVVESLLAVGAWFAFGS